MYSEYISFNKMRDFIKLMSTFLYELKFWGNQITSLHLRWNKFKENRVKRMEGTVPTVQQGLVHEYLVTNWLVEKLYLECDLLCI